MAKKKKTRKKVHRSRATSSVGRSSKPAPTPVTAPKVIGDSNSAPVVASAQNPAAQATLPPKPPASRPAANSRESYVAGDLRRVGLLITLCIIIEIILWILFNHTGLGNSIYSQIKF